MPDLLIPLNLAETNATTRKTALKYGIDTKVRVKVLWWDNLYCMVRYADNRPGVVIPRPTITIDA